MRIYKADGTYTENQEDTAFGWNFTDMEENSSPKREVIQKGSSHPRLSQLQKEEIFTESFNECASLAEPPKPVNIKHVEVDIKTEPIVNVIDCRMEVEGIPAVANKPHSMLSVDKINFATPSKEELAKLITPCNIETKALMSIIYFAKYNSLIKEETFNELFKTVNFKTTNFKCLIKDRQDSIKEDIMRDIKYYQGNKEDSVLSLMMELILADIRCNLGDLVDLPEENILQHDNTKPNFETSDLGNSIQSSFCSRELSSGSTSYWSGSDRDNVWNSIGLDDEHKSLQSFCDETLEMRLQTMQIKESFQEEENRINKLIKMTTALKEELRETQYLEDILYLLDDKVEKVKMKKLPFKVFHKDLTEDPELNLII